MHVPASDSSSALMSLFTPCAWLPVYHCLAVYCRWRSVAV
jgi:hypothetical protein